MQKTTGALVVIFLFFWIGLFYAQENGIVTKVEGSVVFVLRDGAELFKKEFPWSVISDAVYQDGRLYVFLKKSFLVGDRVRMYHVSQEENMRYLEFPSEVVEKKVGQGVIWVRLKNGTYYTFCKDGVFTHKSPIIYSRYDSGRNLHIGCGNGEFYLTGCRGHKQFFKFHSPVFWARCLDDKVFIFLLSNKFYMFRDCKLSWQGKLDCPMSYVQIFESEGYLVVGTQDAKMYMFDINRIDSHSNPRQICCHQLNGNIIDIFRGADKKMVCVKLNNSKICFFKVKKSSRYTWKVRNILEYAFDDEVTYAHKEKNIVCVGLKNKKLYLFDIRNNRKIFEHEYESEVVHARYHNDFLHIGLKNKMFYLFDIRDTRLVNNPPKKLFEQQFDIGAVFYSRLFHNGFITIGLNAEILYVYNIFFNKKERRFVQNVPAVQEFFLPLPVSHKVVFSKYNKRNELLCIGFANNRFHVWDMHAERKIFDRTFESKAIKGGANKTIVAVGLENKQNYIFTLVADNGDYYGHQGCPQILQFKTEKVFSNIKTTKDFICVELPDGQSYIFCKNEDNTFDEKPYRFRFCNKIRLLDYENNHLHVYVKEEGSPYIFDLRDKMKQQCKENDPLVFQYKDQETLLDDKDRMSYLLQCYKEKDERIWQKGSKDIVMLTKNNIKLTKPRFIQQ